VPRRPYKAKESSDPIAAMLRVGASASWPPSPGIAVATGNRINGATPITARRITARYRTPLSATFTVVIVCCDHRQQTQNCGGDQNLPEISAFSGAALDAGCSTVAQKGDHCGEAVAHLYTGSLMSRCGLEFAAPVSITAIALARHQPDGPAAGPVTIPSESPTPVLLSV